MFKVLVQAVRQQLILGSRNPVLMPYADMRTAERRH